MDLSGKNVLILGKGSSGLASGRFVEENGGYAYLYDDFDYSPCDIKQIGFSEVIGQLPRFDFGIISPGISLDNRLVKTLKQNKFLIMSELDVAYLATQARIIAVTGTNGKTTTVSLAAALLKDAGMNAEAVGNIGLPFIKRAKSLDKDSVAVVEVSSFQLEQSDCFTADIATITNITADHMERHGSMERYTAIKKRVFNNIKSFAVMNAFEQYQVNSKKFLYAFEGEADLYIKDGKILYNSESGTLPLIDVNELGIKGEHNILNALTAIGLAICSLGGIRDSFADTLRKFTLPKYRIECLGVIRGRNIFNDSKGTNIGATISAISTMKGSTALLLGGYDKLDDYEPFFNNLDEKVKRVFVCGANAYSVLAGAAAAGKSELVELHENLKSAIAAAFEFDCCNILFSPATSSFDAYYDYKQRGKIFEELIEGYRQSE